MAIRQTAARPTRHDTDGDFQRSHATSTATLAIASHVEMTTTHGTKSKETVHTRHPCHGLPHRQLVDVTNRQDIERDPVPGRGRENQSITVATGWPEDTGLLGRGLHPWPRTQTLIL